MTRRSEFRYRINDFPEHERDDYWPNNHFAAHVKMVADFDRIATDPKLIALVEKRTKRSKGHVPDIPIRCTAQHASGYAVRLFIHHEKITFDWVCLTGEPNWTKEVAVKGEQQYTMNFVCHECGRRHQLNYVAALGLALKALWVSEHHPRRPAPRVDLT